MTSEFATPEGIDALRKRGMSYQEIGTTYGETKDAVRGRHQRWSVRRLGEADAHQSAAVSVPSDRDPLRGVRRQPIVPAEPTGPTFVGFSIGYFDLEASGLNGSFGRLFSAACAHVNGDVWEARIDDPAYRNRAHPSDDFKLAVAIRDHLLEHDILVSWNGKRGYNSKGRSGFDVPMLNARLMVPGHERQRIIGRYVKHIDLLKEIRKYIELHSFRLVSVQEFLELTEEKNSILPRLWGRALDGDKEALDYICLHNRKDVLVLRLVFEEMRAAGLLERPSW